MLSVSFLILLGIPPHIAVATNRFAAIGVSGAFLFAGMSAGGWFGADRALHYGDKIVKQTFIIVCAVLGVAVLLK